MVKKASLAIILPAYKGRFLSETLDSVAAQTCRDFVLYIGDDASPDALQEIVRPYESRLPLVYHRFDRNLGRTDLAGHWERCIALSDEPLVWLFSDDDLMPPDGVARVLEAARTRGMKRGLFRFPLEVIHGDGTVKFHAAPLPSRPVRGYDLLLDKTTLDRMWVLRNYLSDMNPVEAMTDVKQRLERTKNNEEFLMSMNS